MLKLASWNVNSLKVRLEQVLNWLDSSKVDILALQETKLTDENFPLSAFTERHYQVIYAGQKTYNGVAIVSRQPMTEIVTDLPNFVDPQRRILATTVAGLRLINLYIPNGSTVLSDKYAYKLNWLKNMHDFIAQQLQNHPKLVVVGDFNIAPEDRDVHDPQAWVGNVLVSPPERQAFTDLLDLGLKDSIRLFAQEEQLYSWWDYRAAAFRRNLGLRIDHILLSPILAENCQQAFIDKEPRKHERPSDHTPVIVELAL